MKKQGKKTINWIMMAAAVALLSLIAVAYAQENSNKNHMPDNGMMDIMGGKGMDEMHKQMTKNLDSELRNQMNKIHESCKQGIEEDDSGESEMGMM